jgi:hypothetical protein
MKYITAIALALVFGANTALATAQYPDKITYEGNEYGLHTNPMEPYFEKHPDKKPKGGVRSSALWRGYVATFEFRTNSLFLKDIEIEIWKDGQKGTSWKSAKSEVVPEDNDLLVDWFTGILVLPQGDLVNYVHMGYESRYSNYILLEVKSGIITDKRNFDCKQYEQFRNHQFEAFKKTEHYRDIIKERNEKGYDSSKHDEVLHRFILKYTTEFLDE